MVCSAEIPENRLRAPLWAHILCVTVCFGIPRTSADLIALRPGYRVPPDLATVPYVPQHTRFALTEATTSDRMFETTLPAP